MRQGNVRLRAHGGLLAGAIIFLLSLSAGAGVETFAANAADDAASLAHKRLIYRKKLIAYREARAAYDRVANPYWSRIGEKRSRRLKALANGERASIDGYVLEQPPPYSAPPEPKNPDKPRPTSPEYVPVIADFLASAKEHFSFTPDLPANDSEFRHAYAKAALAAGLTAEECVKIYAFESGGDGGYAVQAGLEYDRPGAHAITTALGYNQLLVTNSIELLAEAGDGFVQALRDKARDARGARALRLKDKIAILKKMISFSRSVPDRWSAHSRLAGTDKGLGVHALILDIDVGPLLQVQKLLTSVVYAKRLGRDAPLTAAELEMMNLTGDGNGFDMAMMPEALRRKVPTSNFFQRGGYERNPVAITNNTVAKLIAATEAKMESEAQLPGAKALAAAFKAAR